LFVLGLSATPSSPKSYQIAAALCPEHFFNTKWVSFEFLTGLRILLLLMRIVLKCLLLKPPPLAE